MLLLLLETVATGNNTNTICTGSIVTFRSITWLLSMELNPPCVGRSVWTTGNWSNMLFLFEYYDSGFIRNTSPCFIFSAWFLKWTAAPSHALWGEQQSVQGWTMFRNQGHEKQRNERESVEVSPLAGGYKDVLDNGMTESLGLFQESMQWLECIGSVRGDLRKAPLKLLLHYGCMSAAMFVVKKGNCPERQPFISPVWCDVTSRPI